MIVRVGAGHADVGDNLKTTLAFNREGSIAEIAPETVPGSQTADQVELGGSEMAVAQLSEKAFRIPGKRKIQDIQRGGNGIKIGNRIRFKIRIDGLTLVSDAEGGYYKYEKTV